MNRIKPSCYHLLFQVLHLLYGCFVVQGAYRDGDIILGGLFSIHQQGSLEGQCGALYPKGLGAAAAMIFAIEKINNDSSLLPNITIGYDIRDYCESVTKATQITYDLVKDKCCMNKTRRRGSKKSIMAIIGPYESRVALVIAGGLQMFNISAVSGTTTSPELGSISYKNVFRTIPSDTFLAKAMADTMEYFNWTYVGAVGLADSYGRNGVWSLAKEATNRKSHLCVALMAFIDLEEPSKSARKIVKRLRKHENVRVIATWLFGSFEEIFYREVQRQNLTGRVWVTSYSSASAFSVLDGSIAFQPHSSNDGGFQEYLQTSFTDRAQQQGRSKWLGEVSALRKNCSLHEKGHALNSQNEFCSQNLAHRMYAAYLPYVIDAVYTVAHALKMDIIAPNKDPNGRNCPQDFDTKNLQERFHRLRFVGLTGNESFNDFGDRQSAFYDIVNLKHVHEAGAERLEQIIVGKWEHNDRDDGKHLQIFKEIRWNSAFSTLPKSDCVEQCSAGTRKSLTSPCCWQCVPCLLGTVNPTPGSESCMKCPMGKHSNGARTKCVDLPFKNLNYFSAGGIVILIFGACGVLVSLYCFVIIIKRWNTPIIRASNREVSLALLTGILLLLSIVFINFLEPTNAICKMIFPWRYVTYNLCLATLLVKILRICTAFRVPIFHCLPMNGLSKKKQVAILVTLHVSLLLLLLTWLLLDPPFKTRNIFPEKYIFIACKPYSSSVGKYLFILTCSYIFAQTLHCAVCSFKIRNIPENFSEAKRISFAMYIFFFSLLAFHPVEFSMDGWYVTVVDCVTTLLSAYGLLGCVFLPKIYILLFTPEVNSLSSMRLEVSKYSFGLGAFPVHPVQPTHTEQTSSC